MGILLSVCCTSSLWAQQRDSLRYPINDRRADPLSSNNRNPYNIRDTALIKQTVEYDPKTKQYYIIEKNEVINYLKYIYNNPHYSYYGNHNSTSIILL